ncbi:MAG: hypothetical protein ABJL67_13135, partial [Sulfitobacter sp.]
MLHFCCDNEAHAVTTVFAAAVTTVAAPAVFPTAAAAAVVSTAPSPSLLQHPGKAKYLLESVDSLPPGDVEVESNN